MNHFLVFLKYHSLRCSHSKRQLVSDRRDIGLAHLNGVLLDPVDVVLVSSLDFADKQVKLSACVAAELLFKNAHQVRHIPGRRDEVNLVLARPHLHLVVLEDVLVDEAFCAAALPVEDVSNPVVEVKLLGRRVHLADVGDQCLADDDVGVAIDPQVLVLVLQVGLAFGHQLRVQRLLTVLLSLPGGDCLLVSGLGSCVRRSLFRLLLLSKCLNLCLVCRLLARKLLLVSQLLSVAHVHLCLHASVSSRFSGLFRGLGFFSGLLSRKCFLFLTLSRGNLHVDLCHSLL